MLSKRKKVHWFLVCSDPEGIANRPTCECERTVFVLRDCPVSAGHEMLLHLLKTQVLNKLC